MGESGSLVVVVAVEGKGGRCGQDVCVCRGGVRVCVCVCV